jgi:SPP1 family phage portal protein
MPFLFLRKGGVKMATATQTQNYFGRRVLYTSENVITRENLISVLSSVLPDFESNKSEIEYLYNYFRGKQPILERTKKHRPEINNKVVENHAHEIVAFKVGYDFGEPIQYIRRATKSGVELKESPGVPNEADDLEITGKISLLNEYMFTQDKATQDKDLAEWFFICGTGYRMTLPTEDPLDAEICPFEIDTLDPRYTAVVYYKGFGRKPVMSIQEVTVGDDKVYCIYTPTEYFEVTVESSSSNSELSDDCITKEESHIVGYIPIVEYAANSARIGAFELVISLLDEINNVESNRIDGIEQFVQAFMKFINVRITDEQFDELKELGAISFKSDPNCPADIGIVSSELNQQQVQTVVDHLYQMVLIICSMPDRNGTNRTTGDTGQAVFLRDGWSSAAAASKDVEAMFKKAEKAFLKIVLKIIKDSEETEIRLSDIDIKFIPNKTDNLLTKTQALQTMLEAGINPQIAIATSGLFGDPEQVYLDSLPYLRNKWKTKEEADADNPFNGRDDQNNQNDQVEDGDGGVEITPANNKPNPVEE